MKKMVKRFAKIMTLLVVLAGVMPIQEVYAAPPVVFNENLGLDFDMQLPDGTPYNDAQVLVDIEEEEKFDVNPAINNFLTIGGSNAQDISIVSSNGNYVHNYGLYDIGGLFNYPSSFVYNSFHYAYYTNLRILPERYIRTLSLGDVKTFRSQGFIYSGNPIGNPTWDIVSPVDVDANFTNPTAKFTPLSGGWFQYVEGNYLTSAYNRPTVEFASIHMGSNFTGLGLSNGAYRNTSVNKAGKKVNFVATPFEAQENFVDDTGAPLTPPAGFTQGKTTYADAEQFTHTMGTLPATYAVGGDAYVLQGWYQGPTQPGTLDTTNPPSITIDYTQPKTVTDFDDEGKITVVYAKKALHVLQEKYVDGSDASINSGTWDTSQSIVDGDNFTGTPAATKTDTSGSEWEYTGWKEGASGAVNSKTTPVQLNNITGHKDIYYIYKQKQHTITEKWVDSTDGTTLIPMSTSNPHSALIYDNGGFGVPAGGFPAITDTSGAIWDCVGWENYTDAPGILNPTSTAIWINIKGDKEFRYHYQARNTTATLDLIPTPQVVDSGNSVAWASRVTNTGTSALNNLTLKATSNWATGLTHPTQITVTPSIGAPQNFTVGAGDWLTGVNLTGINIPTGQYADITFTDTATGAVNQVLPAEIELDGNMATSLKAENFVRIDDPNEPNLNPTGNAGLINIPDFRFGVTEVKPFAQKKGLDAASYQGTYNPYIRFMDNESNFGWDLTVKLGQFTSGSKTLPTATAIHLNNGDLKEVQDYNKHNESLVNGTSVGNKIIPSDGTTVALTNGAVQGVYQLDYAFNDVELDLLAHTGVAGSSYTATMDWTLTTSI
ncbi:WxL domain-containing protein [Enterococcus gilvus]|uniref:WxL domain-containing protein n=1 Tax=Enterococcus gilvus TaxID=160453 RepID=UPI001C8BD45E|nr:WxL domain-containing protein [Enterococcus gilvus]MBX8936952.1 hypothetical protein [Enterococcus gilvus]